jgi:hypothetical protein
MRHDLLIAGLVNYTKKRWLLYNNFFLVFRFIAHNGTQSQNFDQQNILNISEISRMINRYNDMQQIINDDIFEPLQNDTVIIVVQVSCFFCHFYSFVT